ncbi:hypothetical protein HDU97_002833 [Phlyctochytrium planicorne]|nr:hypothetical protein HDU97_002833 [Phlyctochytrium planicorne]
MSDGSSVNRTDQEQQHRSSTPVQQTNTSRQQPQPQSQQQYQQQHLCGHSNHSVTTPSQAIYYTHPRTVVVVNRPPATMDGPLQYITPTMPGSGWPDFGSSSHYNQFQNSSHQQNYVNPNPNAISYSFHPAHPGNCTSTQCIPTVYHYPQGYTLPLQPSPTLAPPSPAQLEFTSLLDSPTPVSQSMVTSNTFQSFVAANQFDHPTTNAPPAPSVLIMNPAQLAPPTPPTTLFDPISLAPIAAPMPYSAIAIHPFQPGPDFALSSQPLMLRMGSNADRTLLPFIVSTQGLGELQASAAQAFGSLNIPNPVVSAEGEQKRKFSLAEQSEGSSSQQELFSVSARTSRQSSPSAHSDASSSAEGPSYQPPKPKKLKSEKPSTKTPIAIPTPTTAFHQILHTNGKLVYKCPQPRCIKVFIRRANLVSHIVSHANRELRKKHKCELCPNSFARIHDLHRHTRTKHSDARPHKCPNCPAAFPRADSLKKHMECEEKGIVKGNAYLAALNAIQEDDEDEAEVDSEEEACADEDL